MDQNFQNAGTCTSELKQKQEYSQGQTPPPSIGYVHDVLPKRKESCLDGLYRSRHNHEADHAKIIRVIDILERHPEFQEFLELLRSGLI